MLLIERLDHRDPACAARILALMVPGHAREAALMQMGPMPPLDRSVADIAASAELFLGAFRQERLVGVASLAPDDEPGQFVVGTLVVDAAHERQGVARQLMGGLLQLVGAYAVAVVTGEKNLPALALYRGLGFVAYRTGCLGTDSLPMVKLRRAPDARPTLSAASTATPGG